MRVLVEITAEELQDAGCWNRFCEMKELNAWVINEGQMDPNEKFILTSKEADDLGLLPVDLEQLIT